MAVMASFTPVDVVRLAPVSRRRVPDQDLHPVVNTLTIRLASAEPMLRADLPMSISDVNLALLFFIGSITVVACGDLWLSQEVRYERRRHL